MRTSTSDRPRLTLAAFALLLLPATLFAQLTPIGLSEVGGQWFEQTIPPGEFDRLGRALASGDFNGDGFDDMAIGVPLDSQPGDVGYYSGSVQVRYASPGAGLAEGPVATVLSHTPVEQGDGTCNCFGHAIAAGNFNGDAYDDLAVGVPGHHPNRRGAVYVYYGAPSGIELDGMEILDESLAGEPEHGCDNTQFGLALAVGNFEGDAYDDLVIGVPDGCERINPLLQLRGGSVVVAHGQDFGLLPFLGYRISQDSVEMADEVSPGDRFGAALATGNFNGDGHIVDGAMVGYDDLAIGIPGEGGDADHGAVQIIMGSPFGLLFANNAFWLPGALGELPEDGDSLGSALASGDFDGDGYDDLAIGAPLEDLGAGGVYGDTGQISVAYGAADPFWFDLARTDHLAQSTIYGNEAHEGIDDWFGFALAAGDFDDDGRDDLAIGYPGDDWPGLNHGAVTILMGAAPSIGASTRYRLLGVGWEGLPGEIQEGLGSGYALAVGDIDGSGAADLAIGVPYYDNAFGTSAVGGMAVLYGALFADGFEIGATDRWSSSQP